MMQKAIKIREKAHFMIILRQFFSVAIFFVFNFERIVNLSFWMSFRYRNEVGEFVFKLEMNC